MSWMPSKSWYWAAAGLFLVGTAVLIMSALMMYATATQMRRVVMPGKAELALPVGLSTLYLESKSFVDGKAYRADAGIQYRCSLADAAGKAVPLEAPKMKSKYDGSDYAGESALETRVDTAGTYALACESSAGPFVMAIGHGGVSMWTWVAVLGGGLPCLIAVVMAIGVFKRRRRQRQKPA